MCAVSCNIIFRVHIEIVQLSRFQSQHEIIASTESPSCVCGSTSRCPIMKFATPNYFIQICLASIHLLGNPKSVCIFSRTYSYSSQFVTLSRARTLSLRPFFIHLIINFFHQNFNDMQMRFMVKSATSTGGS